MLAMAKIGYAMIMEKEVITKVEIIPASGAEVVDAVAPESAPLTSIEVAPGIEQAVIEGAEPIEESATESNDLVVAEHMLDSSAPAYSEADEIHTGGWKKRVVVITGASEGIGYATAGRFSLYADIVYNLGLYKQEDDTVNFIKTDVTKPDQIRAAFEKIFAKEGQIDVLINNAGVGFAGVAESTDPDTIAELFNVNFMGTANACACAIPYMREAGRGRIINVASISAMFPMPFQSFYCASKAAIRNFSLALRSEVKEFGIRVTCVMFSEIATEFTEHKLRNSSDSKAYKYKLAKSIAKYEYAEQQGRDPQWVARKLFKLSNVKKPPAQLVLGLKNKFRVFSKRFITISLMMKLVSRKY